MRFLFIFAKLTIESRNVEFVLQSISKILICFAPNLTPVCERCVLTYSHHFDVFLSEAAIINFTFSFHAYFDYNHIE
jgi:hypothetical protein